MIEMISLAKVVYDPQRKFILFLEENADEKMIDGVMKESDLKKEL